MYHSNIFVTGNLGRVDYITETEYDLFIRPDTCNPRFRVWFNFTVENVRSDQVHASKVMIVSFRNDLVPSAYAQCCELVPVLNIHTLYK